MSKGIVMFFFAVSAFARDSVDLVQTPTQDLVREVVAAADEKVREGADVTEMAKKAAHAAADAVKELDALEDKPDYVVVDEEIATAKDVVARLMDKEEKDEVASLLVKKRQQRDMATAPAPAPATVAAATAAGAAAAAATAGDPAVVAAQAAEDATEPAADATPAPTDWTIETVQGMIVAEQEQVTWLKSEQVRISEEITSLSAQLVTAEAELVTATTEKDTEESELATLVATGTATTDALSAKEASVKAYVGQYGTALGARNNLNQAIAVTNVELTHAVAQTTTHETKVTELQALEVELNTR